MADRERMQSSGIFFDGADLADFRNWIATGILGGATTNPVILKDAKVFDVGNHLQRMIEIAGKGFPLSVEIPDTSMTVDEMVDLGKRYRDRFPDNAVVKVPMDPKAPTKGLEAMHMLAESGVRINATLGITGGQLISAAEAVRKSNAEGDNYISLFWARRNEAKKQIIEAQTSQLQEYEAQKIGKQLESQIPDAEQTLALVIRYLNAHGLDRVRVIVGSVRTPSDIDRAFGLAADVVTIKPKLLGEWMHTKRGEETVEEFNKAFDDVRDSVNLV